MLESEKEETIELCRILHREEFPDVFIWLALRWEVQKEESWLCTAVMKNVERLKAACIVH
jgi:hypothetical protein